MILNLVADTDITGISHGALCQFARVLDDLGHFSVPEDAIAFFEKPYKWGAEYRLWIRHGRPLDRDDLCWPAFERDVVSL